MEKNVSEKDIMDKDFLDHNCWFNRGEYLGTKVSRDVCGLERRNLTFAMADIEPKMEDLPSQEFWEVLSNYVKAVYFTVLADLGRDDDSYSVDHRCSELPYKT
ncbi:unnamed protein product [Clonostachys chloroleuca]|uniref:Uncharacterized protein n=1 Tax=Clonostachys chloroleuca TaxID=1926264 RepID=A0AA35LNI4_9HYPO|nr:unnamed protein product [Clonostachys chloroleuca]